MEPNLCSEAVYPYGHDVRPPSFAGKSQGQILRHALHLHCDEHEVPVHTCPGVRCQGVLGSQDKPGAGVGGRTWSVGIGWTSGVPLLYWADLIQEAKIRKP